MLSLIRSSKRLTATSLVLTALTLGACGQQEQAGTGEQMQQGESPAAGGEQITGTIAVDGSSTVFPISQAVAEEFQGANPDAQVSVASSGTGGGMKKFCAGEIDVTGASRPIKDEEIQACEKAGTQFIELPVALDGLAVVANPKNDFAQCLSVDELKKVWAPTATGKVTNWSQVRSGFPNQPLKLYGPGTDSGTFDYFTDAIVGEEGASRTDYTPSEDDNVLVQGVAGDPGALGYFGVAYYEENQDKLKLIQVKSPETGECVAPVPLDNVVKGTYAPLSRPLFIYVSKNAMDEKPAVKAFADFYLQSAKNVADQVGYVPLPDDAYAKADERVASAKTGSTFKDYESGTPIIDTLNK
jgi:phosphate transport system substrate-binding protein